MTNTIHNVPRELLADLLGNDHDKRIMAERHLLAMLANAPSPAGVDGLGVVSNWVLFDAEADKPYIKKMLPEGFLAFFDCEEDARRARANNPGTDYKRIDRVKAEDAQAIIDGLRGKVAELESTLADNLELSGKRAVRIAEIGHELADAISERDRHAWRIGELEGLLLRVQVSLSLDDTEWGYSGAEKYKLLAGIRTALSAGKDAAP